MRRLSRRRALTAGATIAAVGMQARAGTASAAVPSPHPLSRGMIRAISRPLTRSIWAAGYKATRAPAGIITAPDTRCSSTVQSCT